MVDYNNFAKTFSQSRKNMKWEEISYFLRCIGDTSLKNILDIGCGNGRLLGALKDYSSIEKENYLGLDLSRGLLEEAKNIHPGYDFQEMNMLEIDEVDKEFDIIFFIASFHHLQSFEERQEVLGKAYKLLKDGGKIFMTNWALNSSLNKEKYNTSIITNSENEFGSIDYNIKIGEFNRYYHCFHLSELEELSQKSGFKIIENRLFDNKRNFVTILEK